MNKLYTLLLFFIGTIGAIAQTTHNVTVFNFGFDPSVLVIDEGDIVIWNNTEGFHNVDGSTGAFPENPEAFGNEASADLWTYDFQFDMEGTYNYQCSIHPAQMQGTVIVMGPSSTDNESKKVLQTFPVPAEDYVIIGGFDDLPGQSQLDVFDITGKRAMQTLISANEQVDISSLNAGVYIFNLTTSNNDRFTGKIVIQ